MFEERAALVPPLFVRELICRAIQALILSAIVKRHVLNVTDVDHR
jgi:hypothetical protein